MNLPAEVQDEVIGLARRYRERIKGATIEFPVVDLYAMPVADADDPKQNVPDLVLRVSGRGIARGKERHVTVTEGMGGLFDDEGHTETVTMVPFERDLGEDWVLIYGEQLSPATYNRIVIAHHREKYLGL